MEKSKVDFFVFQSQQEPQARVNVVTTNSSRGPSPARDQSAARDSGSERSSSPGPRLTAEGRARLNRLATLIQPYVYLDDVLTSYRPRRYVLDSSDEDAEVPNLASPETPISTDPVSTNHTTIGSSSSASSISVPVADVADITEYDIDGPMLLMPPSPQFPSSPPPSRSPRSAPSDRTEHHDGSHPLCQPCFKVKYANWFELASVGNVLDGTPKRPNMGAINQLFPIRMSRNKRSKSMPSVLPSRKEMREMALNGYEEAIHDIYTCPVCLNDMGTYFKECDNGHRACNDCIPKLEMCPECRGIVPYRTNNLLESVACSIMLPCKNASRGCGEYHRPADMSSHITDCPYNPDNWKELETVEKQPDQSTERDRGDGWRLVDAWGIV